MAKYKYNNLLLIFSLLLFPLQLHAGDTTPMDVIRSSNTKILEIYKTSPLVTETVLQDIFSLMEEVTDFDTMADRAVEKICLQSSEKLCIDIKTEFIKLLQLNSTKKLGRYRADRFEYLGEEITADKAVVATIAHYKKDSIKLDYVLERANEKWMIVNYIANDIDTIQNYQRQFSRIIKKNSTEFLLNRLQKKNKQYKEERAEQSLTH